MCYNGCMARFGFSRGDTEGMLGRKGFEPIVIMGMIALVLVAGAIGYFAWKRSVAMPWAPQPPVATSSPTQTQSSQTQTASSSVSSATSSTVDVSGWKTYANQQYGFELEYPSAWRVSTNGLANILGSTSLAPFMELSAPSEEMTSYLLTVSISRQS